MRPGQQHKESSKRLIAYGVKRAYSRGIVSPTSFRPGHRAWNKGLSVRLSPETEFKKGQVTGKNHPGWKGGVSMTATDCALIWARVGKRIRRPRVIYQKCFGRIPKGYVIYHKDGDNKNDHPSNLEAISRKELQRRNLITGRWQR